MDYINIAGVQFRKAGKLYDFSTGDLDLKVGENVVVDTDRGHSLAKVAKIKFVKKDDYAKDALKRVVRVATQSDMDSEGAITENEVLTAGRELVEKLKLEMRVLHAEIQFGGSKATIYFTAPNRVDFRDMVKQLASRLKARVELKQIGARDETKLMGGLGVCGREFCCSSFLREFVPVSIKMAKNQNLALNPQKVSGGCGRLLCCLTYENDTYTALKKLMPSRGTRVEVGEGVYGVVKKSDVINQTLLVLVNDEKMETFKANSVKVLDGKQKPQAKDSVRSEELSDQSVADEWAEGMDLEALSKAAGENKKQGSEGPRHKSGRGNRGPKQSTNSSRGRNRSEESSGSRGRSRGSHDENKNRQQSSDSKEGQTSGNKRNRNRNRSRNRNRGSHSGKPKGDKSDS